MAGIVTAVLPDGFYVQPVGSRIPAVFVESVTKPVAGSRIIAITGSIGERNGTKCVVATDVQEEAGWGDLVSPVGTSASKAGTTWHLLSKVWGAVTDAADGNIVLDDVLTVPCDDTLYPLGSILSVIGVEDGGVFYPRDVADIAILYLGNGFARSTTRPLARRSATVIERPMTNDRISWVLDQQDGTEVELHDESVTSSSAQGFNIRESCAVGCETLRVLGCWDIDRWETVDVFGQVTTLSDGSRAIIPSGVLVYTDARGEAVHYPLPPFKDSLGYTMMDWSWKLPLTRWD